MKTNDLYKKLCGLMLSEKEEAPENGFKTASEWAEEFGKSKDLIWKMVNTLKRTNKVKTKTFRRKFNNFTRPVTHYKFLV